MYIYILNTTTMNKNFKSLMAVSLLSVGALAGIACAATQSGDPINTVVQLTISSWALTFWVDKTDVINFGEIEPQFEEHTTTGKDLGRSFRVQDLKWAAEGYYTTISVTEMTGMVWTTMYTIPAANIKFKAWTAVKVASGAAEHDVKINSELSANFKPINNAVNYIMRGTDDTPTTGWIIWRYYDDEAQMQITIPANLPAATYKGTLIYTLYDRQLD